MYLSVMSGPPYKTALSVSFVTIDYVTIKESGHMAALILEEFLPFRLVRAADAVSMDFAHIYKQKHGLSRPEWRVLANLAQLGRATATEIGARSSMHKTKVSRAVFELEKRKWLLRKTDENDRRVEWLELTKIGHAKFEGLAVLAREFEGNLLAELGVEATRQLLSALKKLESMQLSNLR
jgi:DNA-binding MarR family transcriptional regulator